MHPDCLFRPNAIGEFDDRRFLISGERSHFFVETAGTLPASKASPFVFSRLNGGGGGSRTRVRERTAWDVYVRGHLGCSRRPPPEAAKKRPASATCEWTPGQAPPDL